MNWNDCVTLISNELIPDEIGNQIPKTTERTILCEKNKVTRSEFYQASASGFKPNLVLHVHGFEYAGETELRFQDNHYKIVRVYELDSERIELTCERDLGRRGTGGKDSRSFATQ